MLGKKEKELTKEIYINTMDTCFLFLKMQKHCVNFLCSFSTFICYTHVLLITTTRDAMLPNKTKV